ncbi:MAG: ATP12 family protein [Pseudomonadota bacterium]
MKRFYGSTSARVTDDGVVVHLDDRPVRTPGKRLLAVPTQDLGEAIADEWASQGDEIAPASMPLTELASTALDHVGPNRAAVVEATAAYGRSDLLCYRADQPQALVDRQTEAWEPPLEWFQDRHGIALATTVGIMHLAQAPEAIAAMDRTVAGHDDWRLAALSLATARLGSLVLAIGLIDGRFDAAEAMALAHLDEDFQIERWGQDDEAMARRAGIAAEVASARRLVDLLKT